VKTIKAKLILIAIVLNAISGAVIVAGMNMAYQKNVALLTDAGLGADVQAQLFADMAGNRNRAIVIAVVMATLMAVALIVALRGLVLNRLDKLVKDAARFIGGDLKTPIAVTKDDEIGTLERDFEQFRVLLSDTISQASA
jgi:methyl-accepting chemotaxis protein